MLRPLIPLLTSLAAQDVRSFAYRARRNLTFLACAALFGFTAYVFLMAMLAVWLAQALGAVGALAVMCAIMLALALGLMLYLAEIRRREDRRRRQSLAGGTGRAAAFAGAAALVPAILPSLWRHKSLLGLSAVAGVAFWLFSSSGRDRGPPDPI